MILIRSHSGFSPGQEVILALCFYKGVVELYLDPLGKSRLSPFDGSQV